MDGKQLDDFLAKMRKQFQADSDDEQRIRKDAEDDLKMVAGDQWDDGVRQIRGNRPSLTFARCHTFVQQVANEARQMRSEIKFVPSEDNDKDTAEVYEGLARHIQYNSRAQVAYETAVDYQAGGGVGYYRFLPDYVDAETNDQEIRVVAVTDPMSVYGVLLPACYGLLPNHAFVIETLPKEEYATLYPNSEVVSLGWTEAEKQYDGWVGTEEVRIAEYWWVESKRELNAKLGRIVTKNVVKCCKTNGFEILDESETEWRGQRIPIFAVLGKVMFVAGKPRVFSVVRFQKDPQRLINLYKSRIAETLGTSPLAPYMVPTGAIPSGQQGAWQTLNTNPSPILEYNSYDPVGRQIPAPTRQVFEPPIQSYSEAAAQEIDDMKATTGIYDASMGARSNETSGTAIARRDQQSSATNMHYIDNLGRSFDESGRELAAVIPAYYDAARTVRILGQDETPKLVKINQQTPDGKHYKIGGDGVAKFDIVVTMGRAFSTKRMESYDQMSQVIQSAPNLLPMFGDIYFRNSDMAGADQIADRFKKMLPPNLQDDNQNDPKAVQAQLQGQVQQSQQQLQQMHAYAQQIEQERDDLKAREMAKIIDNQARMEIVKEQERTKILIAEIGTKAQESAVRMKMEQEQWLELHGSAHDVAMNSMNQSHAANMAAQGQEHEAAMADQSQQQQAESQAQPAE